MITGDARTTGREVSKPEMEMVENKKQEYRLIDNFMRTKGLRLFGYNIQTNTLYEVHEDDRDTIHWEEAIELVVNKVAKIDPRDIFFECLNKTSAEVRLDAWKNGKKELFNLKKRGKINFY